MRKIRVLIVDDSVVARRIVGHVLSADTDLEVGGVAANGRIALAKIQQVNPDVVTLDVEMPVMDGIETLKGIRQQHVSMPVIMFSTLTARGAEATLDALAAGASDYVTKPGKVSDIGEAKQRIREQLIPKIKGLCGHLGVAAAPTLIPPADRTPKRRQVKPIPQRPRPPSVLAIGVSTGGPMALAQLLPQLPGDLPIPILLVQHMPPLFTQFLAERLAASSALSVRQGIQGGLVEPGLVWVAPGDYHMQVERDEGQVRLTLNHEPAENFCRPAVDVLFRSVVEVYGGGTLGVILTGMGQDGLRGCELIHSAGGQVLAQDEASSVVWGMPGFVVRAGLADRVLPLDRIAGAIIKRGGERALTGAALEES